MPSIVVCNSLISRARYWCRQRYLKKNYANKPPKIYYDRRYDTYIAPANLDEVGDVMWVCSELAGACVIYGYCLGDEETHTHGFDGVLEDAYNYAEVFSIPENCRGQYSAQEMNFLEKLIQRGLKDRKKDTGKSTP